MIMSTNNVPFSYDYTNVAEFCSGNPNMIHADNTALDNYFTRYLLQKAMSVFEWKLPDHWDKDYFLYTLYCWGFVAVFDTGELNYGVIPQGGSLSGYNIFYRPSRAIITNPLIPDVKELKIDEDCTIIKLQPDYGGIMDIIKFYSNMLALCTESASTNILNSKLAYVFACDSKAAAESFKKMYDDVASGKPAVFVDKNLFKDDGSPAWETFTQNLKENYIAGDILSDMRKWEEKFDTDIGIPNANTDKKERLITDEVNANNFEVKSKCELWLEQIKKSVAKTNEMFNLDISVDWRKDLKSPVLEEGSEMDG